MVHTVHTNRDKRRGRGEAGRRGGVRETEGRRGREAGRGQGRGQDAVVGVCFVMPKWGKAALTYPPLIFFFFFCERKHKKEKKQLWNYWDTPFPPWPPHHKKTTTLWLSGTEERWEAALGGRDTEARGGSQSRVVVVAAGGGGVSLRGRYICVWLEDEQRVGEGGRGAGRWSGGGEEGEGRGGRGGGGGGEEEGGWPFFFFFLNPEQRHSLCILSSFESTYTICSCRLVDILVYVHSSGREHMQRVS